MPALRATFVIVYVSLLVGACSSSLRNVPIEERVVLNNKQEVEGRGGEFIRIVNHGDTLYSIAFDAGLNVNKLAAWNKLTDTSKILIGQRLRLTAPIGFKYIPIIKNENTAVVSRTQNKPTKQKPKAINIPTNSIIEWQWPLLGAVVKQFSPKQGVKGIDISARKNKQIKTTSAGEVVYVGNTLKGYGNLVIIKHNEHYLSAYANNVQVYVKEGQRVVRNKVIASLGNSSGKSVLHFQIRLDGKPVNPLRLLPEIN